MSAIANELRQINLRLRARLDAIAPAGAEPAAVTPDELVGFFSELLRAGERLQVRPEPGSDPKLDQELADYRSNVERLRSILPVLQAHLLAERAHLEAERTQLEAANAWARAARKTT